MQSTSPRRRPLTTTSGCDPCCRVCGCHVCVCPLNSCVAAAPWRSSSSSCEDLLVPDVSRVLARSLSPPCNRTMPRSLSSCTRARPCLGAKIRRASPTREVTHAFEHQIDMERRLDKFRKSLSMRPDFNLLDFWRLFDTTGKGYATAKEVEDAMRALHVHVAPHEAHLFIKQHSKAGDGKIRYVDMCNAFTPKDQRYADIMQNRLPDYRQYQCTSPQKHMSIETRELVAEVFHLLVVSEVQSESMRHQFSHHNLWHTFKMLDKDNDGYITVEEFKSALRENNVYASENEVKALLARYDTSMDGKVSYAEFVNELGITRCPRNICKFSCTCPV